MRQIGKAGHIGRRRSLTKQGRQRNAANALRRIAKKLTPGDALLIEKKFVLHVGKGSGSIRESGLRRD
jgi:hypothetical protein